MQIVHPTKIVLYNKKKIDLAYNLHTYKKKKDEKKKEKKKSPTRKKKGRRKVPNITR